MALVLYSFHRGPAAQQLPRGLAMPGQLQACCHHSEAHIVPGEHGLQQHPGSMNSS